MVLWTWQRPAPNLALGLSSIEQQPGQRRLRRYGSQRVEVCRRREKRRGSVVLAAKKNWEEIWEPREVTLDESDMAMLELRSLLGEPHDVSIAKLVAKKLNPSATNLEVEKIVKQKGTKTFLKLLRTEQGELQPGVTKKQDAGVPVPLAPKPFGLQGPPRQGYVQRVSSFPEWPEEADIELRRTNERVFDVKRKPADDMIQLSPKPRGANASPSSNVTPRYAEITAPSVRKEVKQPVPKLVPELTSRPSRGGAAEVFPGLKKPAPPKKDLPVPSLSVKPEVPVPAPTVPEETPSPTLEMQASPAPRLEPGLAQRPIKREFEDAKHGSAPQESNTSKESAIRKEPDLLNKPVSSQKVTGIAASDDPMSFQSQKVAESTLTERNGREESPAFLTRKKPVSFQQKVAEDVVTDRNGTEESPAPPMRKERGLLNKPVSFQSQKVAENAVTDRNGTQESPASPIRKEPDLLNKPLSFQSQKVAEVAESNGAHVGNESTEEEVSLQTPVSMPRSRADEAKTRKEGVLPVLEKPPIASQHLKGIADIQQSDLPAKDGDGEQVGVLGSDEAVGLRSPIAAEDPEAQEIRLLNRPTRAAPDLQNDAAGELQKDAMQPKTYTQEEIDRGWALAEVARDTQTVQGVVFVGSNAGGMIVRFGCLNGFLPGKDLLESRGLKTFRSWARDKGHYVNHTSVWDSSDGLESTYVTSKLSDQGLDKDTENHSLHPACEADINLLYREHRTSLLSSMVGERTKVVVVAVDKAKKKLIFSERKAVVENSDIVERRAALMSRLKTGDVVKGRVRNISLFGVFVELVENVSGLIRFSELSWSPVPDPAKLVTVGEEIEAVVHKLDHDRQRIYLSLKRMSPDPLLETVESMLAREEDSENSAAATPVPEFEELIKRLESREEIQEVVKGRRLHSRAVVPSFQVYLSSTLPEGYKLLARIGNEVQEVLVQTTIERDSLISMIRELSSSSSDV